VWIYGGGFTGGSGSETRYDGERLAAKGPVVVTFNYRLGQFGFFAHPELTKESPHHASGNYGMMDAIAALRWVKRNIAAFGGDPDNVTIFGESAGAIMIGGLVGSPQARGLFKRAIGQSGAWMGLTMARMTTLRQQEEAGAKALTAMGVGSIADLRTKSTADVAAGLKPPTALIVDGYLIPEDLSLTYAQGRQNTVDALVGSNRDEAMFFLGLGGAAARMTADAYAQQVRQRFGSRAEDLLKLYPARDDSDAVPAYVASYGAEVSWTMRTWAESAAKKGRKAFVYYFTRVPRQADGAPSPRGAMHTVEIQYAFNNPTGLHWNDVDARLADMMSSYWVNFATKGDPNGPGLPLWPVYTDKTSGRALILGDTIQVETAMPPALTLFDAAYGSLLAGGTD
ncbi:MAG TPA: carboxylesterase family protein, partial [Vicinamibacterales bacterium]|nr:carboxylesterase family protein [Vicinamibacterales bacterium]